MPYCRAPACLFLALGAIEELLRRGVIQRMLDPFPSVWVGVIFGAGHIISALWFGRPFDDPVAQVISASSFGIAYAGWRLHIVSVWPLALPHGLGD